MKRPVISVIVPVYNTEKYLSRCLDSILAQTFIEFEILLINDGSTDNSGKMCDEYSEKDNRVKVFHNHNHGIAYTRNFGLSKVSGEWIVFVDSDDWIEERALSEMLGFIIKENADIAFFDFYSNSDIYMSQPINRDDQRRIIIDILQNKILGVLWNKIFKASIFRDYNVSFFPNINYSEDVLVLIRLLNQPIRIGYQNQAFYHYVTNIASLTSMVSKEMINQRIRFVTKLDKLLVEYLKMSKEYSLWHKLDIKHAMIRSGDYSHLEFKMMYFEDLGKFWKIIQIDYRKKYRVKILLCIWNIFFWKIFANSKGKIS